MKRYLLNEASLTRETLRNMARGIEELEALDDDEYPEGISNGIRDLEAAGILEEVEADAEG